MGHVKRKSRILFTLCTFLAVSIVVSISVGSANISMLSSLRIILRPFDAADVYYTIIWNVRLPRTLLSGLTGAGLAIAGATFQGMFQNPLADPYVLGVSSGAALGATIAMAFPSLQFMGIGITSAYAFFGAAATSFFVYSIARMGSRTSATHIILAGTAISSILSALISFIMTFNREHVEKVYFWTLGSFSGSNWIKVAFLAVFIFACGLMVLAHAESLDALSIGEETAASLGVDTGRMKKVLILTASLLVAACVSVSGIIGFVGLMIPHILRILTGSSHRKLIPFSAFGGAIFLILCDTCARTIASPAEIPVGAVTALFGGPYFIFLLYRTKKKVF